MLVGTSTFALTNQVSEHYLSARGPHLHICSTDWIDVLQFREITFLIHRGHNPILPAYHIFSIWEADNTGVPTGEEIVSERIDFTQDPILVAATRIEISKRYVRLCIVGYDNFDAIRTPDYSNCLAIRSNAVRTSEVDNS